MTIKKNLLPFITLSTLIDNENALHLYDWEAEYCSEAGAKPDIFGGGMEKFWRLGFSVFFSKRPLKQIKEFFDEGGKYTIPLGPALRVIHLSYPKEPLYKEMGCTP